MFFDDWFGLLRILIIGFFIYIALILLLRVAGKRMLSKWNAFDFVVTIALGSILASVVLSKGLAFADGFAALGLLIGMQFVITWLSVRFDWVENLIKSEPTLLLDKGELLRETMKNKRVSEAEVLTAIRSQGIGVIEDVAAVVLETDGTLSIIKKSADTTLTALRNVSRSIGA